MLAFGLKRNDCRVYFRSDDLIHWLDLDKMTVLFELDICIVTDETVD